MRTGIAFAVTLLVLAAVGPAAAGERKLTADDIVARHLQSIGSPEALAGLKSREVEGSIHNEIVLGGVGNIDGSMRLTSKGRDCRLIMRFPSTDYPGERILSKDGKVDVEFISTAARSPLGNFIFRQHEVLDEGLLGGVLSSAWTLLDIKGRQPRLKFDGLKKIDGISLYQLTYLPMKPSTDLQVRLYFDPETFRHVRSSYRFAVEPGMHGAAITPGVTAVQHVTYVILDETFSDFHAIDGFTLPSRWKLTYIIDSAQSLQVSWEATLSRIVENPAIAPGEFAIQ